MTSGLNPQYIEDLIKFPYKLDEFQLKGAEAIFAGENLFVGSATGAGKTTCALIGIAYARSKGLRAICTFPVKALSNQKYGDFQKEFPDSSVGIKTGDLSCNPDADILIATQEIITNLLYTNIEYFDDVGCLVIDETHYINDADRGVVYEQAIAMLPKHINLIMLSATLPGPEKLTNWVTELKGKPCRMTTTTYRPVPLVHQVYWNGEYKQVIEGDSGQFDEQAYKSMYNHWKESANARAKDRENQTTTLVKFLDHLSERELFPSLFFQFSRKGCEKLAKMIQRSFLDGKEQTECLNLFDFYVRKFLGEEGMKLSQYWMLRGMLSKGVAVHHSGLIPVFKEIIEVIFDKGWIRVMFVTETFSVGINMPTKCVVFSELQKFDGKENRCLLPAELVQMAGRAGRRGKDTLGTVIYFPFPPKSMIPLSDFAEIVRGKHSGISSKFIMDPVLLLRCIETGRPATEVFESTLMSKEIDSSVKGIDIEIEEQNTKLEQLNVTTEDLEQYDEINKKNVMMQKAKPKQRKNYQATIREMKKNLGEDKINQIELRKTVLNEIRKLKQNRIDAENYISETCKWQEEVLLNTGYLTHDSESKLAVTLMGRACAGVNESDAFLTVEYLIKFLERFEDSDTIDTVVAFLLGSMIDEKEINKEDTDKPVDMKSVCEDLMSCTSTISHVDYEMKQLRKTYETLSAEERLRDPSVSLTPLFGAYVYLWTVQNLSYNEIQAKMPTELYEGNFVKNMLKVHNICEEWKNIADIYQRPDFAGVIENIQTKIIRDIVVCDSLYIQS